MEITIRLAAPADAPDMAEIHSRSWEAAYRDIIPAEYIRRKNATRRERWNRILTEGNTTQYVIQVENKTVGILCVVPTPQDEDADSNTGELEGIYLHPYYYRKGIGRQAMEFAFEKVRGFGKTVITLWVFAENTNSIQFYETCGFIPDGKTKTYDCGKIMQCIRMRKTL